MSKDITNKYGTALNSPRDDEKFFMYEKPMARNLTLSAVKNHGKSDFEKVHGSHAKRRENLAKKLSKMQMNTLNRDPSR